MKRATWSLLIASILPALAFAQTNISPTIPGMTDTSSGAQPGVYINGFYMYALMVSGLIAAAVVEYGGVKYMISSGNPSGQSDAKEWIWGALIGIGLLGCAYFVLNVINPQLVQLSLPTISGTGIVTGPTVQPITPTNATSTCPIPPLTPITDPIAKQMESGATIVWNSSDAAVQKNLNALQAAYNKFQGIAGSIGDTLRVNSAYRPAAYQAHLYQIYQDATTYQIFASTPTQNQYSQNQACSAVIAALESEENKHGVCRTTAQCKVAAPTNCDPHVGGRGIDITLTGSTGYSKINAILPSDNIPLQWAQLSATDPVHFNLVNPPSGTCPS